MEPLLSTRNCYVEEAALFWIIGHAGTAEVAAAESENEATAIRAAFDKREKALEHLDTYENLFDQSDNP